MFIDVKRIALLAMIILFLLNSNNIKATTTAQLHPNLSRGSSGERVVDKSPWDQVNLFNGNLSLSIPLGQWYQLREGFGYRLALHYNSNAWDLNQSSSVNSAYPLDHSNAGFGWDLSLGGLVDPYAANNNLRLWVYVEPSGTAHPLYRTLHADVYEPDDNVAYTRDGSYYRLKQISATNCVVESPDGTVRTFELVNSEWRLTRIADQFSNYLAISYSTTNVWNLTDNHGRTQIIYFKADPAGVYRMLVDRVVVTAFGGTTATYTFNYTSGLVTRPSIDNDPATSSFITLSLLASVTAPDGTKHTFTYQPGNAAEDASGRLASMQLPTMGKIEWTYQRYNFTSLSCASTLAAIYRTNTGIATRKMTDINGGTAGVWRLTQGVKSSGDPARCSNEGEMTNTVVTPLGDKTVYYFSVNATGTNTASWNRSDYALPLTKDQFDAGSNAYLSSQIFDCDAEGANCRLLQSAYVRYQQDGATDPNSPEVINSNRREVARRTLYHDDVENGIIRYAGVERSDFDGLGHFRREVTNGNFGSGDVREQTVDYNASIGTYPSAGFVLPPINLPWLINIYSKQRNVEGSSSRVIEMCFDRNSGFARRQRVWWSINPAGTASANDVLIVYTADASGQNVKEQYYGGDVQQIDTTNLCALSLPSSDQYQIQHTYQYGNRSSSQYHTAGGASFGQKFVDRDVDKNTGLIKATRDSAGLATQYEYDALNRLTWRKPAAGQGTWTQYNRTAADAANYAKTFIYQKQNGGSALFTYKAEVQDSFGRVWWEQVCRPDGNCPSRYLYRNALGWVTYRSEYSNDTPQYTAYFNYDPFGRARVITPPEGSRHNTIFEYTGFRSIKRTDQVGYWYDPTTMQVQEQPSSSIEVYDRQGRKWKSVIPPRVANTAPDDVTFYQYDVAGNLTQTMRNGAQVGDSYNYDGRGFLFLTQDTNNGSRYYQQFDALGNAHQQRPYLTKLTYIYDRAGRLTKVQDASTSMVLKEFVYADTNGTNDWRAGKLWTTKRYNYMPVGGAVAVVTETNFYGGKDGRLSRYELEFADGIHASEKFAQTYEYDELGNVKEIGYPGSIASGSGNMGRSRKITYSYAQGLLTKVEGTLNGQAESWASSIGYFDNSLVSQVTHSNGVTDNLTKDSNGYIRPAFVSTSGVKASAYQPDQNFSSGDFQYDGSGNLVRVGSQYFVSQQGYQPPPASTAPSLNNSCQNRFLDQFGFATAAGADVDCNPLIFIFYTASDRQVKVENRRLDKNVWAFTDTFGQPLTQYTRANVSGAWISTRDYIYRGGVRLAMDETLQAAPLRNTTHYHPGYGVTGIATNSSGYKIQN